jgi:hypothetical protein
MSIRVIINETDMIKDKRFCDYSTGKVKSGVISVNMERVECIYSFAFAAKHKHLEYL